jgi:uncharacterized protein
MKWAYAIPVLGRWLLYAPFENAAALAGGVPSGGSPDPRALDFRPRPPRALDPLFLGIVPTRDCNMACVYCGFWPGRGSEARMDYRLATAAVRWLAENRLRRRRERLDIHFFGGEPLFAFDVVEVVVHAARRTAAERRLVPHFEVCTNGFLTESQADFVGDHFHTVILSLDGPPDIQNRYRRRKGSSESCEIVSRTGRILSERTAELCLRACVTQESVARMAEISEWFSREFRPAAVSWEILKPTPDSNRAGLRAPDPLVFASGFEASRRILESRGIRAVYAADLGPEPRFTFCPVGRDALLLTPDGRVSACYLPEEEWTARGMSLTIGRLGRDGNLRLSRGARPSIHRAVRNKPLCDGCFCRWSCAGGCHVHHSPPGRDIAGSDFCVQTRIITACSLLRKMGEDGIVDELLADRGALERLARRSTYAAGES